MNKLKIYIDKRIDDPEYSIYIKKFFDNNEIEIFISTELKNSSNNYNKYDYYIFLFTKKIPMNFWNINKSSIINHAPCYNNIYYKNLLIKFLSDNLYFNFKFMPYSFTLNLKLDNSKNIKANLKIYKMLNSQKKNYSNKYWIMKPYNGGLGTNLLIVKKKEIEESLKKYKYHVVIQKYIDNPLLIDNKKFHIRVHVLLIPIIINKICEGYEIYYDPNYFGCMSLYEYDQKNTNDTSIHITNPNLQKETEVDNDLLFIDKKKMSQYLNIENLDKNILNLCKLIFLKENLPNIINPYKETNCYELFGLDLLLDNTERLWLLEINVSPGMDIFTSTVKKNIIPQLLNDMFTLIFSKIKKIQIKDKVNNLKLIGSNKYLI